MSEATVRGLLKLEFLVIIMALVCGFFGVFLPMCLPKNDCVFGHAMSAGVLIAAITTHLLPESIDGLGGTLTGSLVGATFIAVVLIEDLARSSFAGDDENHDNHPPKVDTPKDESVSSVKAICLLVGLSVHSVIEGFGIGTAHTEHKMYFVAAALLTHKIIAGFALGQTILSTRMKAMHKYVCAMLFVVATPIGGAIGLVVRDAADIHANKVALIAGALEAGAFLQISAVEIIPHIFHLKGNMWSKHLGLAFGFALMAVLSASIGHGHEHGHGHGCEGEHNHGKTTALLYHGNATALLYHGNATGSDHHHECHCLSDDTQARFMVGLILLILIASLSSAVLAFVAWQESKTKQEQQDTKIAPRPRRR